ncbi:MAG TPA: PQQ-dependent sugar dehydrogenase [Mycobacteriales bacterium]|nr:PQQ-dependent sugar dehydrogenase [Mycobacteriales bacterium]
MRQLALLLTVLIGLSGCHSRASDGQPTTPTTPGGASTAGAPGSPRILTRQLEVPWSIAFLPDGDALVSERDTARILKVTPAGAVTEVQRLSEVVQAGEGGLLGLAVSPGYATDKLIYAYYTAAQDNRIARFVLGQPPQPILTGIHKAGNHDGGRIAFGPDGMLYAGVGDAAEPDRAQDPTALNGKVLRMTPAGRPAPGNPFPDSVVYSYGHRNVQGLAWDSAGRLYASEFGQNQFDEINLIQPGHNYGWPVVEGAAHDARYTEPLLTWSTDQASPSGIAILNRTLYVGALRGQRLWSVPLTGDGGVGQPVALFTNTYGRLRAVTAAPDGSLWVGTSNRDGRGTPVPDDDRILRITP